MSKRYPRLDIGARVVGWFGMKGEISRYGVVTGYQGQSPMVKFDDREQPTKERPSSVWEVNAQNEVVRWLPQNHPDYKP